MNKRKKIKRQKQWSFRKRNQRADNPPPKEGQQMNNGLT